MRSGPTRTTSVVVTVLVAVLVVALSGVSVAGAQTTTTATPTTSTPTTSTPTTTTVPAAALTRTTISVGGVVDEAHKGAEVGAQARFARANAGGGVAGRTVVYVGTSPDAKTATATPISAVVPAASTVLDTAALAAAKLPFFGAAEQAGWTGNASGFGFAGAQVPAATSRTASPAWGITMKALLGRARGKTLAVATSPATTGDGPLVAASLRAAGFTVPAPTALVAGAEPGATARALATAGPDGVVLLADVTVTAALASSLAAQSYAGTVATTPDYYRPENPAVASGLTVLLPYAPPEQPTAANRAMLADLEKFAPGTKVTANVVAGYRAADEFVAALTKAGKRASAAQFAKTLRTFTYFVKGTVGPTAFPAAHAQPSPCGALVQSDGTRYFPVVTYRCGKPVKVRAAPAATTTSSTAATTK